jgi:hypothetical protein
MNHPTNKPKTCGQCGGTMVEQNIYGEGFPYRHHIKVRLSTDIVAPKCMTCGEILLNGTTIKAIDVALAAVVASHHPSCPACVREKQESKKKK